MINFAYLVSAILLATSMPALTPTATKVPNPVVKPMKISPNRTAKQRLALARRHVGKSVTAAQLGTPIVLSPLDRYVDDKTTMLLFGVELPIPNQEFAYVEPAADSWPIQFNWPSGTTTTYLVDCIVYANPEFEVLAFQADPGDVMLEHAEQLYSSKIKLQDQDKISFPVYPAANKNVLVYVRSTNKLQFTLQRCEITPVGPASTG
jgi:hypothetical protein